MSKFFKKTWLWFTALIIPVAFASSLIPDWSKCGGITGTTWENNEVRVKYAYCDEERIFTMKGTEKSLIDPVIGATDEKQSEENFKSNGLPVDLEMDELGNVTNVTFIWEK